MSRTARVQRILALEEDDLQALCEAVDAAILDGGGFGWLQPQGRQVLERYFRGLLLVPERMLFAVRLTGLLWAGPSLSAPRVITNCKPCASLLPICLSPPMRASADWEPPCCRR